MKLNPWGYNKGEIRPAGRHTYVNVEVVERKGLGGRILLGNVPENLVRATIPLDGPDTVLEDGVNLYCKYVQLYSCTLFSIPASDTQSWALVVTLHFYIANVIFCIFDQVNLTGG